MPGLPDGAKCIDCEYPVHGLTDPFCPECGRAFDFDDLTTVSLSGSPPSWRLRAAPPRLWHTIFWIGAVLLYSLCSSLPGGVPAALGTGAVCAVPVAVAIGLWLGTDYVLRSVAAQRDRPRAARDRGRRPHPGRLAWLVMPCCLVLIFSMFATRWPLRLRFSLSRDALERAVLSLPQSPTLQRVENRIGLFRVMTVWRCGEHGVYFQTGMSGFDKVGLDFRSSGDGCRLGQWSINSRWTVDDY